jgi:uncharacterized protein (DUF488 family)
VTLANACTGVDIRYEHLPQLGIASEQRRDLKTEADYQALFEDYKAHALPTQTHLLETIRVWVSNGDRVALTCFERLPEQCHRHCVAEALAERFGMTFLPAHL